MEMSEFVAEVSRLNRRLDVLEAIAEANKRRLRQMRMAPSARRFLASAEDVLASESFKKFAGYVDAVANGGQITMYVCQEALVRMAKEPR